MSRTLLLVSRPANEDQVAARALAAASEGPPEEDRPPVCPRCNKRVVILSTQRVRGADGAVVRRQLWGCPRGHATVYRTGGSFGPIELLPDVFR